MFEIIISVPNTIQINKEKNEIFFKRNNNILPLLNVKDVNIFYKEENIILLKSNNLNNLKLQKKFIQNTILGLIQGFKVKLSLIGIGYKYFIKANKLYFKLNKSHLIYFQIPSSIKINQIQGNILFLTSIDLQELTLFIQKLKSTVKPNSYKKKGLFFYNENTVLKKKK